MTQKPPSNLTFHAQSLSVSASLSRASSECDAGFDPLSIGTVLPPGWWRDLRLAPMPEPSGVHPRRVWFSWGYFPDAGETMTCRPGQFHGLRVARSSPDPGRAG